MAVAPQLFGNYPAQVEIIIVKHDHRAGDVGAGEDVLWREHMGLIRARNRLPVTDADSVSAPTRAGCEHHVIEAEFQDVLRCKLAVEVNLDVGHLPNAPDAPVAHTCPGAETRQAALLCHAAAEFGSRLGQGDPITALAQRPRRFEPRRPGTDDEHRVVRALRRDAFRVPAAAPFLAHARVLGATHGGGSKLSGDADVAADAFADLVDAPLFDLLRQEGIGDRWPRRTDHVQHAALDLAGHGVRRGEPADANHGFRGHLLDEGDVGFLRALLAEARGDGVVFPVTDVDVPQVG